MLAVFFPSVAVMDPVMKNPESSQVCATAGDFLARRLVEHYPRAVTVKFKDAGYLAIDDCPTIRTIVAHEDVYCLFFGKFKNTEKLKEYLKLSESATDPQIVTELYKMWKQERAHIVDSPLSEAEGSYAFILYDRSCNYVAIGVDPGGGMPLFWGVDGEDNLVVTNLLLLAIQGCSRSYAPFPPGFLYTSSNGLMHFKHPLSVLEHVPWIDYHGKVCGSSFRVRAEIEGRFPGVCKYPRPKQYH